MRRISCWIVYLFNRLIEHCLNPNPQRWSVLKWLSIRDFRYSEKLVISICVYLSNPCCLCSILFRLSRPFSEVAQVERKTTVFSALGFGCWPLARFDLIKIFKLWAFLIKSNFALLTSRFYLHAPSLLRLIGLLYNYPLNSIKNFLMWICSIPLKLPVAVSSMLTTILVQLSGMDNRLPNSLSWVFSSGIRYATWI